MSIHRILNKSVLVLACATIVMAAVPASAADISVNIVRTSTPTVTRGWPIGIDALVANNSSGKARTSVTLKLDSTCGTSATIASSTVTIGPHMGTWVSAGYPIPASACVGTYTVTATATSGGKNGTSSSLSTTFNVQ